MSQLEEKKEALTQILSDATKSNQEIMDAGVELSKVVSAIDQKTERWLELSEFI